MTPHQRGTGPARQPRPTPLQREVLDWLAENDHGEPLTLDAALRARTRRAHTLSIMHEHGWVRATLIVAGDRVWQGWNLTDDGRALLAA